MRNYNLINIYKFILSTKQEKHQLYLHSSSHKRSDTIILIRVIEKLGKYVGFVFVENIKK